MKASLRKASFKLLALGLLLFAPFATAQAQAPSLSPIPNISLNAGTTMTVNVVAVDVLGRPIALTASLPAFATVNEPTSGTGVVVTTLTLTPSAASLGNFTGAVTATAGGVPNIKIFQIMVNAEGSDQAPVVTAPALHEVTTGSNLSFTVGAGDPDGDGIASLDVSGLPVGATFTPNGSNTSGTFSWTPGAGEAGEYDLMFTASNSLSGTAVTHVTVENAPTLMIVPIDDVTVAAGGTLSVPVSASGLPGALITLTATLPAFATLDPPGSGMGSVNTTISLAPPNGSAGTFHVAVTATSLGVSVTELFDIIVTGDGGPVNNPPVLTAPATQTVEIGSTLNFDVTATDADGDHVDLFGSALPPGSNFTDNGDNTGTFTWSPVSGQAGTHVASFSGNDNRGGSGSASTTITVTGGAPQNQAPTLSAPSTLEVDEGESLSFTVTASDPDGDHVTLTASSVPFGATFSDQGDNTGIFSWTPGSTQSGVYEVAFVGDDGNGGSGNAMTMITVIDIGGGGGGGEIAGKACLIGKFKPQHDTACFRIRPVNGSFDVRHVDLSSLMLVFNGQSIAALSGRTEIELDCHGHPGGDGDDDDGDDDGEDDGDGDRHKNDQGKGHEKGRGNGHDPEKETGHDDDCDDGDDVCGVTCDKRDNNGQEGECDTLGIRACFSTEALLDLFANASLPCSLLNAEIHATLTNGTTVVATFGGNRHEDEGDSDNDKDKNKDKGKDEDRNAGRGGRDQRVLNPKARPNPLNPMTELSFTMSREGRVRVTVYDMQGRLVNTLLDEVRSTGVQKVAWDGSNARSQRVASGVYFFRIQAPEGEVIQRVAVVK